jgi:hypothetical protein
MQKELVAEQQASQEACSQRREDDLLMKALGNKEHHGQTHGVGSSVPWKYGFPDYASQYKKRTSNKAEKDARLEAKIRASIRAELTSEFDEKLESGERGRLGKRCGEGGTESPGRRCCCARRVRKSHPKTKQLRIN